MKLLPWCFLHTIAHCLHGRISSQTHYFPCIRQWGSCILLRLEWHQHLLICPQLPRPRFSKEVRGSANSVHDVSLALINIQSRVLLLFFLAIRDAFVVRVLKLFGYGRCRHLPCYFLCYCHNKIEINSIKLFKHLYCLSASPLRYQVAATVQYDPQKY